MRDEDENTSVNNEVTDTDTKPAGKIKKSKSKDKSVKKKVADKATAKSSTKATAKSSTKAKGNGKAKDKKVAKKPASTVERDQFGFRKGSKKSQAAALYATKKGATLNEVKEKTGSSQLNLLTELKNRKYKVTTTKEQGAGKKQVTRYKIVLPEKAPKPEKAAKKEAGKSIEGQASA